MAAPSWLATQPPTPMRRSRRTSFRCLTRPRSWKTFSCAFSRTEQVLNRIRSASSGRSVVSKPPAARNRSAILSESYSFIWQPKVRMKSFFATLAPCRALLGPRELGGREQPHPKDLSIGVQDVIGPGPARRDCGRHDDQILLIADLGAGRELHRLVVHGHDHLIDMADVAPLGVLGDGRGAGLGESGDGQQHRQEDEIRGVAKDHGPALKGNGGESGTRTPDLRIMIPSL